MERKQTDGKGKSYYIRRRIHGIIWREATAVVEKATVEIHRVPTSTK